MQIISKAKGSVSINGREIFRTKTAMEQSTELEKIKKYVARFKEGNMSQPKSIYDYKVRCLGDYKFTWHPFQRCAADCGSWKSGFRKCIIPNGFRTPCPTVLRGRQPVIIGIRTPEQKSTGEN